MSHQVYFSFVFLLKWSSDSLECLHLLGLFNLAKTVTPLNDIIKILYKRT